MTHVQEPVAGSVISERYFIEKELGRGGFGVVYKARHIDIEHTVALKVLLTTFAAKDATAVERFRREAVLAARLHYPNTVRVFDYGHTDDGVFYIVMEFLEGHSLDVELARHGTVPVERTVHICEQVLQSLSEAHAHNIVHRDIKPENIMINPLSYDHDFVKVMDFGIAKMVDADMPSLTQAGKVFGTPKYMAPEQLRGEELTPATDVYAVGHIMVEMLTGEAVVKQTTLAAVIQEIVFSPSATLSRELGLPPGLCDVVDRACCKDLTRRYANATLFLNDLRAWRDSQRGEGSGGKLNRVEEAARHAPHTTRIELPPAEPHPAGPGSAARVVPLPVLLALIGLQILTLLVVLGIAILVLIG